MDAFLCAVVLCALPALLNPAAASITGNSARIDLGESNEGTIYIGSPPQPFTVLFDTGSSDVFVTSFKKDASSSYVDEPNQQVTLGFGSGKGNVISHRDTLKLGNTSSTIEITDQTLGVAEEGIKALKDAGIQGVFGLAFEKLSKFHENPVFLKLVEAGVLTDNSFTFAKTREGDTERENDPLCRVGVLYLSNQTDMCVGDFSYVPVTQKTYWFTQAKQMSMNDYTLCSDCKVAVDTGSSNFMVPADKLEEIHAKIGATRNEKGQYEVDCDTMDDLPNLEIQMSDEFTITLSPEDYINEYHGKCTTAISRPHVKNGNFYVLGMAALDGHCVQFRADGRIGFAPVKEIPKSDPSCKKH